MTIYQEVELKLFVCDFPTLLQERRYFFSYYCAASVASEQQHKQDLRKIYRRGDEFSN